MPAQVWKLITSCKTCRPSLKICTRSKSSLDGRCGTYQAPNSLSLVGVRSMMTTRSGIPSMFTVSRRHPIFGQITKCGISSRPDFRHCATGGQPSENSPVSPDSHYTSHTFICTTSRDAKETYTIFVYDLIASLYRGR